MPPSRQNEETDNLNTKLLSTLPTCQLCHIQWLQACCSFCLNAVPYPFSTPPHPSGYFLRPLHHPSHLTPYLPLLSLPDTALHLHRMYSNFILCLLACFLFNVTPRGYKLHKPRDQSSSPLHLQPSTGYMVMLKK